MHTEMHMHTETHVKIHICTQVTHSGLHKHVYAQRHEQAPVYVYIHTDTQIYVHKAYICTCIHIYTKHIHTCIHTLTNIYTHTHTPSLLAY